MNAALQVDPSQISLGVDEAARITDCTRTGIYKAIAAGDLKAFKIGRRRLILVSELKAFVERAAKAGAR
ncbi:DNA binding domain, excisionase family [Pseudomonas sp. 24 E 13]|uniref:helix-turn-helix domain-containing protein n=1 Tax=unclassified Pseudomonas TaxID=196821 RepID=UPI00081217CD|nr:MULTISPECIES: helix-turn-helix domain-containing protein [unclassified Pseudomonas]RFD25051.1 DNA-binding protein [Pseudomonas sp. GL93]CRM12876.1 DNA binding domain, excisionase family [Pseudomonas sp. 24 E 13]